MPGGRCAHFVQLGLSRMVVGCLYSAHSPVYLKSVFPPQKKIVPLSSIGGVGGEEAGDSYNIDFLLDE